MRTQFTDESYTSIIEDVLYLCKKANKNVPQRDKLRYMLKEINEEALGLVLLVNLPFLPKQLLSVAGYSSAETAARYSALGHIRSFTTILPPYISVLWCFFQFKLPSW